MGTSGTLCVTPIFILISIYLCTNDAIVIFISFFDWFHNIHFTIPSICIILCKNTYLNKEVWGELVKEDYRNNYGTNDYYKKSIWRERKELKRKSEFSRERGKGSLHNWMIFCIQFLVLHFLLMLAEHLPLKEEALDGWSWQQWTHKWILTYGECSNKNRWRHLRH